MKKTKFFLIFTSCILLYPLHTLLAQVVWNYEGNRHFSNERAIWPVITANPDNLPIVAYINLLSFKVEVMQYTGTVWEIVGKTGDIVPQYSLNIKTDNKGVIYVASKFGGSSGVVVMKYDNDSEKWLNVGPYPIDSGRYQGAVSLDIGKDNEPVIVFDQDSLYGPLSYIFPHGSRLSALKFDGTNWIPIGKLKFSPRGAKWPHMALSYDGMPYVVFQDSAENFCSVMNYRPITGWQFVGPRKFSRGPVMYHNIAVDPVGVPYVAYRDSLDSYKVSVRKYNRTTNNWDYVGPPGFTKLPNYGSIGRFVIDKKGTPYVSFTDVKNDQKLNVMKYDRYSEKWVYVGQPNFTDSVAIFPEMAIDQNGTLHVVYTDKTVPEKISVMYYVQSDLEVHPTTSDGQISVYPNPTSNNLIVEYQHFEVIRFELLDAIGRIIVSQDLANGKNEINTKELSSGVYFYKVTKNNNCIDAGRVLKN